MNLLLVRHGEIPSNIKKVYAGKSSENLTDKGILQAESVSHNLKLHNVKSLYSSPIARAVQTAKIISRSLELDVITNDYFREMEMGPWEGLTEKDVEKLYPEEWSVWKSRPADLKLIGRETLEELLLRVLWGIREIYQSVGEQTVVVVTHVAIIRVLLLWFNKKNLNLYKNIHVPNAKIFRVEIDTI